MPLPSLWSFFQSPSYTHPFTTTVVVYGSGYDGDWKNDHKEGKGKYTHASGSVYEGDW